MPDPTTGSAWPFPNLPLGVTAVMLPELGFDDQRKLCAQLGVTRYVYRPRVIADDQRDQPYSNWGNHRFDLTPQRLLDEGAALRDQLSASGLQPFGTVPTLTTTSTDDEIELAFRGAVAAGASRVRLGPGGVDTAALYDFAAVRDRLVGRYRDVLAIAKQVDLEKIVIEIHAGLPTPSAGLARHVLDPFDPNTIGAILDLPNLAKEGFTAPAVSISSLGDYLDHLHVGGSQRTPGDPTPQGYRPRVAEFCCLRGSDLYVPEWLRLVAQLGREVPLIIEDYSEGLTGEQRLRRTVQELHDLVPLMRDDVP